jgi:hypothetical protein
MAKTLSLVFGVVFVLVGVLGWIPNPIVGPSGIFETNFMHDLVHLVIGLVFLYVAFMAVHQATLAFKVVGVVYLLIAVLGFFMAPHGGALLGLVHTNAADHWLHVVLGVVLLGLGFMLPKGDMMPAQSTQM